MFQNSKKDFFSLISTICAGIALLASCVSCAPERGDFTSSASAAKKLIEKQQSSASTQTHQYNDAQFEVLISDEQEKSLQNLITQMNENEVKPKAGMYRTYSERNPLLSTTSRRKDIFIQKETCESLTLETINADSGKMINETTDLEKQDFISQMVFLLGDLKNLDNRSTLYQNVKKYLNLLCREKLNVSSDYKITVQIDRAKFQKTKDDINVFRLVAEAYPTDYKDVEPLTFEIRFRVDLPKPFQCFYKAWGKGKGRANQVLFSSDFYGIEENQESLTKEAAPEENTQSFLDKIYPLKNLLDL